MAKLGYRSKNVTGKRFGRLIARVFSHRHAHGTYWSCDCDCGKTSIVFLGHLTTGQTQSCGCMIRTHGMSKTLTYQAWKAMKNRCYNSSHNRWYRYGGRGVKVCRRWLNSFEKFLIDMGEKPVDKSLDRYPNPDGHYKPSNCRWATTMEQRHNRGKVNRRSAPKIVP